MKTKTIIAIILIAVMAAGLLVGCGAKNNAVGTWKDEQELCTFVFKNDGTGTLSIYVAMFKSSSYNEITYTCEGNTIQYKFKGSDDEYSTFVIENDTIDYGGVKLRKK